ncbi:LysM peptidoglycan-binding domain-containing protein [Pseudomonas aeruginosa]
MSKELNKALDLLREIRPSIPKDVLELWCKDRDAFLASHKATVEQAGGDELEKFLAWACKEYEVEEGYELNESNTSVLENKKGWMARAALAQPSPAQTQPSPAPTLRAAIDVANDRFEVPVAKWGTDLAGEEERPEVAEVAFVLRNIGAMDAEDIDGDNVDLRFEDAEGRDTGCDVSIVEYAEKAADLFEQHDRIVGELRADRDSWAEQAEQRLADWDEMRKERDAALARVAELERQEPVALANRGLHAFWVKWTEAAAGLYGPGIKLYAAPVAQAQHSVPAYVSYTTRPAESLAGISLRQLKDESRWVEIRDINAHAFPDMQSHSYYPAGTVIKLPAAAPGKSVPQAWLDVLAERRRQITAEGWTPEHDDLYCAAELPRAAAAYILSGANDEAPAIWPFLAKWWKPRDARANYMRAGALILAEIERLDRAAAPGKEVGHE